MVHYLGCKVLVALLTLRIYGTDGNRLENLAGNGGEDTLEAGMLWANLGLSRRVKWGIAKDDLVAPPRFGLE